MKRKNLNDVLNRHFGPTHAVANTSTPIDISVKKELWGDEPWDDNFVPKVTSTSTAKATKSTGSWYAEKCTFKHPALTLPGTDLVIYGGSCSHPAVADADVYIGFDKHSMLHTKRAWPWKKGTEFLFPITDMAAPDNPEDFRKLVEWVTKALHEGKKVHCGCIGGHGRTGTFLAALVKHVGAEEDAITYVRKNYCEKAVESASQINFLKEHWGIKDAKPSKGASTSYKPGKWAGQKNTKGDQLFTPLATSSKCVWGRN